jgi:DNA mismatch repair ATPase MutS
MKAHLLYPDRDFDLRRPLPWNVDALSKDLALNTLFCAMAMDDKLVFEVCRKLILSGLDNDLVTILYRQENLRDCLAQPSVLRELYALVVDAMEQERKHYLGVLARYPNWVLRSSADLLEMFVGFLRRLRKIADMHADKFSSGGWAALFATLKEELSDEYFARVVSELEQLRFRNGTLLSAELGEGNKGKHYSLHIARRVRYRGWDRLKRLLIRRVALGFSLHPRDENGARALAELRDRGISSVAVSLAQSAEHVRSFFDMLRIELAFYVGCLNLYERLGQSESPTCFAVPEPLDGRRLSFRGLRDVCLLLSSGRKVVGNDVNADGRDLVIITGANQGGKSTFLRSIGLAQLMMQSGMFVTAESFRANVCDGLFTHYKREEDARMKSGKLDEELSRMSDIIDHITPHSMILFNESFAATNEREGSEIAQQILSALMNNRIKILFVTHLYQLADAFYERKRRTMLFLRADRQVGGARTFKLTEGAPLQTSFGEDLYNSIFGVRTARSLANDEKVSEKES